VIALGDGDSLPDLPPGGIRSRADLDKLSIVETIEQLRVAPGSGAGTYAFVRTMIQRNLYRIPLPRPGTVPAIRPDGPRRDNSRQFERVARR